MGKFFSVDTSSLIPSNGSSDLARTSYMRSTLPLSCTHAHTHTHTLTHSLTHSLLHSLTHSHSHSLTLSLTHSHTHSLTHSLTQCGLVCANAGSTEGKFDAVIVNEQLETAYASFRDALLPKVREAKELQEKQQ